MHLFLFVNKLYNFSLKRILISRYIFVGIEQTSNNGEDLMTLEAEISELQRENARVESQMLKLKSDINAMENHLTHGEKVRKNNHFLHPQIQNFEKKETLLLICTICPKCRKILKKFPYPAIQNFLQFKKKNKLLIIFFFGKILNTGQC